MFHARLFFALCPYAQFIADFCLSHARLNKGFIPFPFKLPSLQNRA